MFSPCVLLVPSALASGPWVVEAVGPARALAASLPERVPGLQVEVVAGDWVQVRLADRELEILRGAPGVARVRRPHRPHLDEERISEGLAGVFQRDWAALGLTGEGVHVAIVDSGFQGYLGLLGSELPDSVETHFASAIQQSDHGTAVAEIVHDMAPDAALHLYGFDTEVEFLAAIEDLMDAEVDVVNCCVSWDNVWHPDDDNPLSTAVNALVDQGVTWVQSNGNDADNYASGVLEDTDGDGWLELAGLERIPVHVADGYAGASLRWEEVYGQASIDLALGLYREGEEEPCAWSDELQDGSGDPWEGTTCSTEAESVWVALYDPAGAAVGVQAWLWSAHGLDESLQTPHGSVAVPSAASGALSVGAVHWWDHSLAPYSSLGPTHDGRVKPDLSAPTLVTTSTSGFMSFSGTSAATPHVSGAAALLVQASDHAYGPDEIRSWLQEHALDLGPVGEDNLYGAGYLQLDKPPGFQVDSGLEDSGLADTGASELPSGCGCASKEPFRGWLFLALPLLVLRRSHRAQVLVNDTRR